MKKLLIVDGNSILNRAFYGIRTLTNSKGMPTNAVYGMVTMLSRQIEKYAPEYMAIAFDVHAPTFRHKMYEGYKATRKGMPDELAIQLPYAKRVAEILGFTVIEKEGFEADDILGSLANCANGNDLTTLIMTGDKDSLQLINDNTVVLLATNTDYLYFDRTAFLEKYGVQPEQFVDVKAIMGDSSDNIPGISGIGEKGALALISQFGSLENIYEVYENSDLKPSVIKKLQAGKDSAFLSQTLARIEVNVPDLPQLSNLNNKGLDREAALQLFTELEFTALIKKFDLDAPSAPISMSNALPLVSIDSKNVVLDILSGPTSYVYCENDVLYVFDGTKAAHTLFDKACAIAIADNCENVVTYDVKTVYKTCDSYGIRFRSIRDDIMLAAYVLDSQGGHDIDKLVVKYLGEPAAVDGISKAIYVHRLSEAILKLYTDENCVKLYKEIELPLAAVLADMEEAGFLIDREGLAAYGDILKQEADALAERIYFLAGEEFNINSPKQLAEILFEKLKLPSGKKTKTGYSTNAEVLQKLASKHPIVSDILDYRQLTKLIGTYVTGLLKVASADGRIHTNFKQTGTATGRLSSAEPNLQNIPIRTDAGRELRKYFLPKTGYKLISADYSQIELRLLACISGDESMLSAFTSGEDIHTSTAAAVFGLPADMVTPLLRKRAKAVNFGIVYGIGEYSLSQDLDISVKQAKEYIENYLASYPGVRDYLNNIVKYAAESGSVDTLYGRKRYIPEIQSKNGVMRKFGERVAMNSPIQGSAADIIKIAMIGVNKRLAYSGIDAKLILQVHDELIIEAAANCTEEAAAILREEMESAVSLPIPLTVDLSIGDRWYEA